MTLAELQGTTALERWRSLTVAHQEAIGARVLTWLFAELVADDDGTDANKAERNEARALSEEAFRAIDRTVQAAFPGVLWYWPAGTRYVVYDRHGQTIGEIVERKPTRGHLSAYRFIRSRAGWRSGRIENGTPGDCLPRAVMRELRVGGRWFAVPPGGEL